ncbi:NTP/NDP exchange transporter [Candidatus Dependentiae bacterium]
MPQTRYNHGCGQECEVVYVKLIRSFSMLATIKQFLKKITQSLWGKFESRAEVRKFLSLAVTFFFMIFVYWIMHPVKDSIFAATVGVTNTPWAKIFSAIFLLPVVMIYTKLIDTFKRDKVFYIMMIAYAVLAIAFAAFFMYSEYGLADKVVSSSRIMGWLWYFYVESFGSVIVALFWVIVTDITLPESAKRGFPLIYLFGQIGNLVGPYFITAKNLGFKTSAPIIGICGLLMFLIGFLLWLFMRFTPKDQLVSYEGQAKQALRQAQDERAKTEEKVGFLEGIKIIMQHGYLMGILFVIMTYEIIVTIFDYQFKVMAKAAFPLEAANAAYLAKYGYTTGIVATLCVLFGINSIQRKLGMFTSLLMTPILVAVAIFVFKTYPVLGVAFWIMVFAKAINYALNQPTLKNLYVPVTKVTRYKSMSWIEMFGGRSSKSLGSAVNLLRKVFTSKYGLAGVHMFIMVSSYISFGLVIAWLFVAFYLAKKHKKAIAHNEVVC